MSSFPIFFPFKFILKTPHSQRRFKIMNAKVNRAQIRVIGERPEFSAVVVKKKLKPKIRFAIRAESVPKNFLFFIIISFFHNCF